MRRIAVLLILLAVGACAAQPAPPPSAALQQFVLFFRANEASITEDGHLIINQIVLAVRERHPAKIAVEGRADGDGPADAQLARHRAQVVVAALREAGIDPQTIEESASVAPPDTGLAAHQVTVRLTP
jgi:outer membrane protein OmpA-like peptidoglycan-associated protein